MKSKLESLVFKRLRLLAAFVLVSQPPFPAEPAVRIGIQRNVEGFTLSSMSAFTVEGLTTSSATFSTVVVVTGLEGTFAKDELVRRMAIELDDRVLIRPLDAEIRVRPGSTPLEVDGRPYRGDLDVLGTSRGAFTVVNELSLEEYLLGVVPNELGPDTFPQIEALKAQAVAARTYIVRNLGQYADSGYDICATDQCQVYRGLDTEHPLTTEAVSETRGLIATYGGEPINALYSSTCGGQTEDARNVFGESVPYLVSTICHYDHPTPQPFASDRIYGSWEDGLLGIARVDDFQDAARFMGVTGVGSAPDDLPSLADFIKRSFFPDVPAESSFLFLQEQGVLMPEGDNEIRDVLVRLLLRKDAFEWQAARLIAWDGNTLRARVGQEILDFGLKPDAAIFKRVGDQRIPVDQGAWVGGESMDLRVVDGQIEGLVFRAVPGTPSADRYSPVARWQTHRTREELDEAVSGLNIGGLDDVVVLDRGPSNRVIEVEIRGLSGRQVIDGPRFRTLFALRDSRAYIDEVRNSSGELLGMTFFGGGWGHGVGLCQVGAYGMAIDGASAEEILKTYYQGIEVQRIY